MASRLPDHTNDLFIITLYEYRCLLKRKSSLPGVFTVTTISKGCRDVGNRLAITNNQHTPNIHSKLYLIEDNICKISV